MANVCVNKPYIDNKPSILYDKIYKYTNKNKKLTNYLYILATEEWFVTSITNNNPGTSSLNSLGQLDFELVKLALNILKYLDDTTQIHNAEISLGAKDSSGNVIKYDSIESIYNKVFNFNKDTDLNLRAIIKKDGNSFIISVETLNISNYDINNRLKAGLELFNYIILKLLEAGFNTNNLSDKGKLIFNYLNAGYFALNIIPRLLNLRGNNNYSEEFCLFLLDILPNSNFKTRLLDKYGNRTAKVLKYLLNTNLAFPSELNDIKDIILDNNDRVISGVESLVDSITRLTKTLANNMSLVAILTHLQNIYNSLLSQLERNIKLEYKDLKEKYNIHREIVKIVARDLSSLEEVTDSIIENLKNNLTLLKARGYYNAEDLEEQRKAIKALEDKIESKEYVDSIISFLLLATDTLLEINATEIPDNIDESFNLLAILLLNIKEAISSYTPILGALLNIDSLADTLNMEDSDKRAIMNNASKLNTEYTKLSTLIRNKLFDLVHKYLKRIWGEETKTLKFGDTTLEIALEEALALGTEDFNICDRYLYSMTEVNDPILATFGKAIRSLRDLRDDKLREIEVEIRRETELLFQSGSNTNFMFETLSDGTVKLISNIDYEKYNRAKLAEEQRLIAEGNSPRLIKARLKNWEALNCAQYIPEGITTFSKWSKGEEEANVVFIAPNENYRKLLPSMTAALKRYYDFMMRLKATMDYNLNMHGVETFLYDPVLITGEISDAVLNSSAEDAYNLLKNNFVDKFKIREDDTLFGDKLIIADSLGHEIHHLPTFYLSKLKDLRRVLRDFSKAMNNYTAMAMNHFVLSEHVGLMELSKDWLLNERDLETKQGNRNLVRRTFSLGKTRLTPVTKKTRETSTGEWLQRAFEAKFYGIKHDDERLFDSDISASKLADSATTYTSITGLTANVPGAIANALVGKLLMLIESAGGRFWGMKDMIKASAKYDEMLLPLLGEIMSNNKKSKLALLMELFDVLDDFYEKVKETGFYKNPISKIIGNTSLFFLYGMGEHMLHALTMLAVLLHEKVIDTRSNKEVSLLDAFLVNIVNNNGNLYIPDYYKVKDKETGELFNITDSYIERRKNIIASENRTMHGAFGDFDKGLIHTVAWGRLLMNFRLWMPAHFARRFRGLHYNATLDELEEGYYVTAGKFIWDLLTDITKGNTLLRLRWKSLGEEGLANIRKTLAEATLLIILFFLGKMSFGDDPKHRSWAEAMAKYQIRRMYMETAASSPLSVLDKGAFLDNLYKMANEPFAAISPAQRFTRLFGIEDLLTGKRIETGPHKGDLVYMRNIEKAIPFYDLVWKWWNMDSDDSMFKLFNNSLR